MTDEVIFPTKPMAGERPRTAERIPPEAFFICSAIFHYLGPAFAVLLFARVEPTGVAWLRIASAAAILAVWRRPWRGLGELEPGGAVLLLATGLVLAAMNVCFYLAIARLPLGTVAAIEFLPVIGLAAAGVRTPRNILALALAISGVYLLAQVAFDGDRVGFAFAFANAALFAAYVVLGHRLARRRRLGGVDGLAAAMATALVAVTPIGLWSAAPVLKDPIAVAAGVGVGVS